MSNTVPRVLLGVPIAVLGTASVAMTARYGFLQAQDDLDRIIAAVMAGAIALCAVAFHGIAIRLWVQGAHKTAGLIGIIGALAFLISVGNSFGSVATRSDAVEAQRQTITDTRSDNRRELTRLEAQLAALGSFQPVDQTAVDAATRAAETARQNRRLECDKRGPNCRQRETEEKAADDKVATATTNKATTDRAQDIETRIAGVRTALGKSDGVASANPVAKAWADALPWLNANAMVSGLKSGSALVFELCILAAMIAFEMLGHTTPTRRVEADTAPSDPVTASDKVPLPTALVVPPATALEVPSDTPLEVPYDQGAVGVVETKIVTPKQAPKVPSVASAVRDFMASRIDTGIKGVSIQAGDFRKALKDWCDQTSRELPSKNACWDQLHAAGIRKGTRGNRVVYLGLRLRPQAGLRVVK
jgi:hypothetical protein